MTTFILFVFVLLLATILLYFQLAAKYNIIDKSNQRSSHTGIIIRGGGIVFYLGVLFYSLFQGFTYPWFLAGIIWKSFRPAMPSFTWPAKPTI